MKRLVAVLAMLPAALAVTGASAGAELPLSGDMADFILYETPVPAPRLPLVGENGAVVDLSVADGKVRLVNFWATFCGPCRHELPGLHRLEAALGGPDFAVTLVSWDLPAARQRYDAFLKRLNIAIPASFYDEKRLFGKAVGVTGLPTTILIDGAGRIIGAMPGLAAWDGPDARALIEHIIADGKAS